MKKSKYKNLRFDNKEEFDKWLEEKTKYILHFEDQGQDFLTWWVDERGEVLHSDMQSFIWNGTMIKLDTIKEKMRPELFNLEENAIENSILNYRINKLEIK